jgi:hypothetical protein
VQHHKYKETLRGVTSPSIWKRLRVQHHPPVYGNIRGAASPTSIWKR